MGNNSSLLELQKFAGQYGKRFHNSIEIICHACALMKFWAGLQKKDDKEALIKGVTMFKIVVQLLSKTHQVVVRTNMLQDATRDDETKQDPEH